MAEGAASHLNLHVQTPTPSTNFLSPILPNPPLLFLPSIDRVPFYQLFYSLYPIVIPIDFLCSIIQNSDNCLIFAKYIDNNNVSLSLIETTISAQVDNVKLRSRIIHIIPKIRSKNPRTRCLSNPHAIPSNLCNKIQTI